MRSFIKINEWRVRFYEKETFDSAGNCGRRDRDILFLSVPDSLSLK